MKNNKKQEDLYNRILINFGIAILAYSGLYFIYENLYMNNTVTFSLAAVFAVIAIVFYSLSGKKPLKNYAHMFTAFAIALLFTRLSVITVSILGFEKFFSMQEMYWFKKLMQTRWEVIFVAALGAIYLVGMLIYNIILIKRTSK